MQYFDVKGVKIYKAHLTQKQQKEMVETLRDIAEQAPMYQLKSPWGKKLSVKMTSAGTLGWYSDDQGYRYRDHHPNGSIWPEIPASLLRIWSCIAQSDRMPNSCLINYYAEGARMGMHQDKNESDYSYPVVSISLGDSGLFRIGNVSRGGKTDSIWLESGDVCVLGGSARLVYHGIDRIRFGSSSLLTNGGRLNVTLRVAC